MEVGCPGESQAEVRMGLAMFKALVVLGCRGVISRLWA